MALIPIVIKPYPDELLYSWIMRLAKINGLQIHNFINAYFGNKKQKCKTTIAYDIKNGFLNFYDSLRLNISADRLYLQLSTFGYECIGLSEANQTRVLNNVFFPNDRLNTSVNTFFSALNICPDCIKEDIKKYDEPYFHRAHQLSGIYKCYKHGVVLRKYKRKNFTNIDKFNLEDFEELNQDGEDYSKFAYELLNANIDIDVNKIISLCDSEGLKIPEKRLYGYSTGLVLPYLYSLCKGDINVLKEFIKDNRSVIKGFKCDQCGYDYFTTTFGYSIGWRCPLCLGKQNEQTRFKSMVSFVGNNEYELISEFKSMNEKLLFRHTCGLENNIRPRSFFI